MRAKELMLMCFFFKQDKGKKCGAYWTKDTSESLKIKKKLMTPIAIFDDLSESIRAGFLPKKKG